MPTLKSAIADDVTRLLLNTDEHATAGVTYTPADGSTPSSISVVLAVASSDEIDVSGGEMISRVNRALVSRDADEGIENPAVDDELTLDSQTWVVTGIESQDDYLSVLHVVRAETGDRHGPGYEFDRITR